MFEELTHILDKQEKRAADELGLNLTQAAHCLQILSDMQDATLQAVVAYMNQQCTEHGWFKHGLRWNCPACQEALCEQVRQEMPEEGYMAETLRKQIAQIQFASHHPTSSWGHSGTVDDASWRRFEQKCLREAAAILIAVADAVRDCNSPGILDEITWQSRVAISRWLRALEEE